MADPLDFPHQVCSFAPALGYEHVNDHDTLRAESLPALALGRADVTGQSCAHQRDRGYPLASSSTLNRLELSTPELARQDHYERIVANVDQRDALLADVWLGQAAAEPQGRDRRDPDGSLQGNRLSPLRTRRTRTRGGQDRGRPGYRGSQDRGVGVLEASAQPGIKTVEYRERLASRIGLSMKAIEAFCNHWRVEEFALFGSVLREDFGPESDIDIMIRFKTERTPSLFGIVDMERELGDMFGRRVHLVTRAAVEGSRNYLRRKAILGSAKVVYSA